MNKQSKVDPTEEWYLRLISVFNTHTHPNTNNLQRKGEEASPETDTKPTD